MKIEARPWTPQDLLDDLQGIIDEESDNYLNTRRTTLEMALSYLKEHFTEPKWIPVTERLPEKNNQWVLCLCVGGAMEVLKFDYPMWNWDSQYPRRCYMESYVTHWMPLPEPPEEERQ